MIGNSKRTITPLITPAEAVKLSLMFSTCQTAYIADDIKEEFMSQTSGEMDGRFRLGWLLSTLYEAGRIQGIREERQRRKPKPLTL